jgi:G3E family GTPase
MGIPLHLVTGFLGSGKSSFLNHYLENFSKKRKVAIIQNEFSPVGIDGRKLRETSEYALLEINNGSVFCVCLLGSFIDSLAAFVAENQPDVMVMEASGLSDPIGVGQVFQSSKLKGKVYLEHVWCLVDALNFGRVPSLNLRLEHQLRSADTIIINKIDLAGTKTDEVVSKVKQANPFARVVSSEFARVNISSAKKAFNFFPAGTTVSLGRPEIESLVIRGSHEIKPEALKQFFDLVKENCIRCKGFIKLYGGKFGFVQGVFDDFSLEEVQVFSGAGELVLIGNFKEHGNLQLVFDEYCKK